jgi:ABC-type branched-subunit amino acid transport system ATPase component
MTFVVIEHKMKFVMSLCTRILVLAKRPGRSVQRTGLYQGWAARTP